MKKKLLKNGLLTTLGVVSATLPLATTVSCGNAEQQNNRVGSEYDKEYGVDEAVYAKLKSSFVSQATIGLPEEEVARVKKSLNKIFNTFDEQMDKMNLSYTAVSNGLIEYAARVYPDVKLVRETTKKTVKWDDLTVEFEGMVNSMKAYMDNVGIHGDDQTPFIEEAKKVFNGDGSARYPGILQTVQTKYHDPLMGLMQAKAQMLQCFEAVDEKIGLVGAAIRLGQFFENHEIIYNKGTDDTAANKFDNMKTWLKEEAKGTSIHEHIADIFEIKNKTTGETLKTFNPEEVCPGYIVKPILKGWTEDPIKNEYKLIIDWTCINVAHKDSEKADLATAHCQNGGSEHSYSFDEKGSDFDFEAYLNSLNEKSGITYDVILSRQGEIDALKKTYFNNEDEHIVFGWKEDEKQFNALDAFFFGDRKDDRLTETTRKYGLDTRTLAMTGLNIGTKANNQNAYELTRLDSLMQTSVLDEEEKQNIDNDLINDFLQNCKVWSNVDITLNQAANDVQDQMKASLYAQYSNSSYDDEDEEVCSIVKDIELQSSNFVVSEQSYHYLTEQYNTFSQYTEPYANNMFESSKEDCTKEIGWNALLYSLSGIFAIQTTAFCFVPVFAGKIPIYIALLALTWVSMGAQSAALGLLVKYKHEPLKKFTKASDELIKKPSVKNFVDYIKKVGDEDYLCRANDYDVIRKGSTSEKGTYLYNYERFKEKFGDAHTFLTKILPEIDKFQTMLADDDWKQFTTDVNESECSPSKFDKAMEGWAQKGVFTIANWVLTGVQIGTDVTCIALMFGCPEMTDWQVMKEARLAAQEAGESTQYVVKTYRTLAKIKSFRKALQEEAQNLMLKTLKNQKFAPQVEERFLESADAATGELKTFDNYEDVLLDHQYPDWWKFRNTSRWGDFARKMSDRKDFVDQLKFLIQSDRIGFKNAIEGGAFSARFARNGELITKVDELGQSLATRFLKDLNFAFRNSHLGLYDKTLDKFIQFYRSVSRESRLWIESTFGEAEALARSGQWARCAQKLQKFDDELIEIAKDWILNPGLTDAGAIARDGVMIQDVLQTPLAWAAKFVNELRNAAKEGSQVLFTIL